MATTDLTELALRTGHKLSTVRRAAQRYGWVDPLNPPRYPLADLKPTDVAYLRQQLKWGITVEALAAEFGVAKTTMYRAFERYDVRSPHPQQAVVTNAPEVFEAYAEHGSLRKTGKELGIPFWRVQYIIRNYNPDGTRKPLSER